MGTNEVTESLRRNEIFVDLPLQKETSSDTSCNHFVRTFTSMYTLSASKSADMAVRALKWKAGIAARTAALFRQFERYTELVRCQNNVLAIIKVANYLQACGSVALVVRTAGTHEKSHAETGILRTSWIFKYLIVVLKKMVQWRTCSTETLLTTQAPQRTARWAERHRESSH